MENYFKDDVLTAVQQDVAQISVRWYKNTSVSQWFWAKYTKENSQDYTELYLI